jgi:hypothetical protein
MHAPNKEKCYDSKDSFCEELGQVFDHYPMYHMKMLLGDLHDKMEGEYILKSTIMNEVHIKIVVIIVLE